MSLWCGPKNASIFERQGRVFLRDGWAAALTFLGLAGSIRLIFWPGRNAL
ncbi:MAG: hypothetical protein RLY60_45, partial [Pseudomonadota bacterium]